MPLELSSHEPETPGWQYAVTSGILGWVLDAFDFFVVIFLVDTLAANFHVDKKAIVWTISIALAMRPVGALIFGSLADRFGRRLPLIACVLYFSAATLLSGFAPNYATFVTLRALYGIGMGGYWGVGASLWKALHAGDAD
jgi:SHS family lactate transporter-like MFS transporter